MIGDFTANERGSARVRGVAPLTAAVLAALLSVQAHAATKPRPGASDPLLVPVKTAHCHRTYGLVEKRLKGRGTEVVSAVTRNGLKDFFVRRPGVIDCTGERKIPWQDAKDRDFIVDVLRATNAALKSRLDMTKAYGVGPAPEPVKPASR